MSSAEGNAAKLKVPEHELLRLVGRGSYGEVWLARTTLGRFRAVKFVFRSRFEDDRPYDREYQGIKKFEPISRSHPGFVSILQIGANREEGYFYYVMEAADDLSNGSDPATYIPHTLASELKERPSKTVREASQLGIDIGHALAALHDAKLVHRDIKPSNIVFIDRRPRLGDIGLVTDLDATLTFVGTPGFMPIEGPGTVSADIYSLGKTLYEAVTGKDRHAFPEYPEPSAVQDFADYSEFNEVLLKACHHDPARRYTSARALTRDLQLLLNGESVLRLRRLEARVLQAKRAGVLAGFGALLLAVVSWPIYREAGVRARLQQEEFGRTRALAGELLGRGDYFGALRLFYESIPGASANPDWSLTESLRLNLLLEHSPAVIFMHKFPCEVHDIDISPDRKTIIAAAQDGGLRVMDRDSNITRNIPTHGNIRTARFNRKGDHVLTAHEPGGAIVWSVQDWSPLFTVATNVQVMSGTFGAHDERFVLSTMSSNACIYSLTGELLAEHHHGAVLEHAQLSADGTMLATAGRDAMVRVWRIGDALPLKSLPHGSWVFYAEFTTDAKELLTAEYYRLARVWDVADGRPRLANMRHEAGIRSAVFSEETGLIATAGYDSQVRIWSARDGSLRAPILHQGNRAMKARFSRDGKLLATAVTDGVVRVYELPPLSPSQVKSSTKAADLRVAAIHGVVATELSPSAKVSPYGRGWFVAAPDENGQCHVSFLESTGKEQWSTNIALQGPLELVHAVQGVGIVQARQQLVGFDISTGARLWKQTNTNREYGVVPHPTRAEALIWFGKQATYSSLQEPRELWRVQHPILMEGAAFSKDGELVATYDADAVFNPGHVVIRDSSSGKPVGVPLRHKDGVLHAAFNQDATLIATGDEDFTAHIWDVKTGRKLHTVRHTDQVTHVAFSENGLWLATGSKDFTAQIWDVRTGEPVSPPLRHNANVMKCAFDYGDKRLLTEDANGRLFEWKLNTQPPEPNRLKAFIELTTPEDNQRAMEHWAAYKAASAASSLGTR
ncbi:MAG TPA: PQQ-binding-like beta-propeller repeat protein [Methylomirabilota bacterium]|nr:PQQ-binding-like beta-propeller repeat protein [Methylomirabilota bacterium]